MNNREIDDMLKRAGQAPHPVDPALLERIAGSIQPTLQPVRPLPSARVQSLVLFLICAGVAVAGAARLGFGGIVHLSSWQRLLIFPVLGLLAWMAATGWAAEMVPGSARRWTAASLLGIASVVLVGVFAILFQDYRTEHFVHQGVVCLTAGLFHAAAAAILGFLLLRRGYAVNPAAAGLAGGILAGLAGASMLELHCANFEAPHVMLWHTAVVPISALIGAWLARRFRSTAGSPLQPPPAG